jgi:hypothetical protein
MEIFATNGYEQAASAIASFLLDTSPLCTAKRTPRNAGHPGEVGDPRWGSTKKVDVPFTILLDFPRIALFLQLFWYDLRRSG